MNDEMSIKISEGGRIVIPSDFRKKLGIQIGDELILKIEEGELRVLTKKQAIRLAQERFKQYVPKDRSLADELIAERRTEAYE